MTGTAQELNLNLKPAQKDLCGSFPPYARSIAPVILADMPAAQTSASPSRVSRHSVTNQASPGAVVVAILPLEEAELRQHQVHEAARAAGFPLRCLIEPAQWE